MRILGYILFSMILFNSLASCVIDESMNKKTVSISLHLQDGFNDELVSISLNDASIFSGQVTSDDSMGFAKALEVDIVEGETIIYVDVEGVRYQSDVLDLREGIIVGILKARDDLIFTLNKGPIWYD